MMLAESLLALDRDVAVTLYDPDEAAPAYTRISDFVGCDFVAAPFDDADALRALFARVDRVTFESENIPVAPLERYAAQLVPNADVLRIAQDRRLEKRFLASHGFPTVPFVEVPHASDVAAAFARFGGPAILKTALGGYDGKGQWSWPLAAGQAIDALDGGFVLERRIELLAELSCIVSRSTDGQMVILPPFENLHADHILDFTVLPARLPAAVTDAASRVAVDIAHAIGAEGLLTVEFFYGRGSEGGLAVADGALFVNELAPRPHNSGHVTRRATTVSQFDLLARVLLGRPLAPAALLPGGWCMGQLLGDLWEERGEPDFSVMAEEPAVVEVYLYGKREARPRRKMGHFLVHARDAQEALTIARRVRSRL